MPSSHAPSLPRPWPVKSKRPRVWLTALGWALALGASAQGTSPAELAAQALNAPNVRALTQADTAVAKSTKPTVNAHEAQLSAIRQAILEATLDRPTRVLSSAWVDEKGALHESAHFHSEAQVRGVRVLSYIQDDAPQTRVSAEVLPWGWKPTGTDKTCAAPPRAWRLPLVVHVHSPEGFSGTQNFATHTLLQQAHGALMHNMQNSQRWRTHSVTASEDSTYQRALMGHEEIPSGWTAEISLQPHSDARPASKALPFGFGQAEPTWQWTLTLTLGQRQQPNDRVEPKWQVEQVIAVSPSAMVNNPSAWARQMQAQLQQGMRHWVAQLDKRTECEPVQFHVRRQGNNALQLQAGQGSGLRPGDRVLLMSPSHVPSRMLEAGAAQHLALAEVVQVGQHRTELQQLAGPALASQGPWMALPL